MNRREMLQAGLGIAATNAIVVSPCRLPALTGEVVTNEEIARLRAERIKVYMTGMLSPDTVRRMEGY